MDKLTKQIEQMIIEKSLSLEVLTIVNQIKEEHAVLLQSEKEKIETIRKANETITELMGGQKLMQAEIDALKVELKLYQVREAEFNKSEHTIALKDKDVASSERALHEVKNVVGMVFKNTIVREGIARSSSVPVVVNGYTQYENTSECYNKETVEIPEE